MFAATMFCVHPASAADKPIYGPPAAWVQVAPVPEAPPAADAPAVQTLLDDNQARLTPAGDAFYNRRVRKILRPEGLSSMTSVTMTWKPDTETMAFHTLRIIRDGKVIDLLRGGHNMLVIRRETNLEEAMLDGRVTASQQIEGLQVGDIVDFSWTETNHDPIAENHSHDSDAMDFAGVAGRYRVWVSWPDADKAMSWRTTPGFGDPAISHRDGYSWLEIDKPGAVTPKSPAGAPLRFRQLGSLEVGDFVDWATVSKMSWPHYAQAMTLRADSPLKAEAATIAAASADPKARAFAALQLVEDKTRYFAIALGEGGYVPAKADDTWTRRFGDCKGKTVLLLALLKELGIEAEPVLVNTRYGDGLNERMPSIWSFDHVIVRAHIGGHDYWLDGTRTGDRSGLSALKPPPYLWGLPLRPAGANLEAIDQPQLADPIFEASIRLDASKGIDTPALMTATIRYSGDYANLMRQAVARTPAADLDRAFRQQLSSVLNFVDVDKVAWIDDAPHDAFALKVTGTADLDWRMNPDVGAREYKIVDSKSTNAGYPHREAGPNQDAPFTVPYPVYIRSNTSIVLPAGGKGFTIRGPNGIETVGGYVFKRASSLSGDVATFAVEIRTTGREISPQQAAAAAKEMRALSAEDSMVRAPK